MDNNSIKETPLKENEGEFNFKKIDYKGFKKDLEVLINRYCIENTCNTPDFILSDFLFNCLRSYSDAIITRDGWFDFNPFKNKIEADKEESKSKDFLTATVNIENTDIFQQIIKLISEIKNDENLHSALKNKIVKRINEITTTFDYLGDETEKEYNPMKGSYENGVFHDQNIEDGEE
jgi:hypothetical protein